MTLSDYSCQLVQMRNLPNEVGFNIPTPYIYSDNLGSLFQRSNCYKMKVWTDFSKDSGQTYLVIVISLQQEEAHDLEVT